MTYGAIALRNGVREVKLWERTGRLSQIAGEMGFALHQDLGFESILLVEGVTDVKLFWQVLRHLDKDHKVVVIPIGGDNLINDTRSLELEELKRITPSIFALVDSERTSEGAKLSPNRHAFLKSCEDAGIRCHITKYRASENYLTDAAVKRALAGNYRALGPYERLKDLQDNKWGKNDN